MVPVVSEVCTVVTCRFSACMDVFGIVCGSREQASYHFSGR